MSDWVERMHQAAIDVFGEVEVIRTGKQNNSLHKALREVAEEMFMAGMDMRTVIKVPIRPTMENVKAEMLHPVMRAMYPEIESTADLTTVQTQELWAQFSKFLEERLGIFVQWPSEGEQ